MVHEAILCICLSRLLICAVLSWNIMSIKWYNGQRRKVNQITGNRERVVTEEEIHRLRSYLAMQSMRRTPQQIMEALQEVYHQFTTGVVAFPHRIHPLFLDESAWSVSQIVEHVALFLSSYKTAICTVLEKGQRPPDVLDRQEIIPHGERTERRDEFFFLSEKTLSDLASAVLQADPLVYLDLTWKHFELGEMHWREWLLFARVHLLDHLHQVNHMQTLPE